MDSTLAGPDVKAKLEAPVIYVDGQTVEGTVKFWNLEKGYGFVTCDDGGELFCHRTTVKVENDRFQAVVPGTKVSCVVLVEEGKQSTKEVLGTGGKLLPGFGSKRDAEAAVNRAVPGTVTGVVKFMRVDKGFGFILPDDGGEEVFFHQNDIAPPLRVLEKGEAVSYTVGEMRKDGNSKAQALNISSSRTAAASAMSDMYSAAYGYGGMQMYDPYGGGASGGETVGTVKWFNVEKGFGFLLTAQGTDIYFRGHDVVGGAVLQQGETVKYSATTMGSKQQAINVTQAAATPAPQMVSAQQMQMQQMQGQMGQMQQQPAAADPAAAQAQAYALQMQAMQQAYPQQQQYADPAAGAYAQQADYASMMGGYEQQQAAPVPQGAPPGDTSGSVKWYSAEKGFGFVIPSGSGGDIYFKGTDVSGADLQSGESVTFSVLPMGDKQQAVRLARAEHGGGASAMDPAAAAQAQANAQAYAMQLAMQQQQQQAYGAAPDQSQGYSLMAASQYEAPGASSTPSGTVKWFSVEKGFGFIIPEAGGGDIYFRGSDVVGRELGPGETVKYNVTMMGSKQQAINVARGSLSGGKRKAEQPMMGEDSNKRGPRYMYAAPQQQMGYPEQGYYEQQ